MKHLIFIIIGISLVLSVGCISKQASPPQHEESVVYSVEIDQDSGDFIRNTFEAFITLDSVTVDNRERIYFEMLELYSEDNECGEDNESNRLWYRKNIAHIDSLSRYCIELSENENTVELLNILEVELPNFQSHPNADTYLCFDLNIVMTRLYFLHAETHPDYLNKCISLWELNRLQIDAVQKNSGQAHPLYIEVLQILSSLYEHTSNLQKAAEMDSLINEGGCVKI